MKLLTEADVQAISWPDLPLVVLSDNLHSWFAWRIRRHTAGHYNHAMWMIEPGKFVTQDWTYRVVDVDQYLTGHHRLKFWRGPWSESTQNRIVGAVRSRLRLPRRQRRYDWLGILGQRVGLPGINFRRRYYCSEDIARVLCLIDPHCLLKHPSPEEINAWAKQQHGWAVHGIHDPDLEDATERSEP